MVRETRHLWVGNLPDNIREDRIREHFKRYGRVQSVKLLPRCTEEKTGEITMACTVAFMDIKSASKAHNAELKIDDRTLNTEYYEPAAIPSSTTSASIGSVGGVNVIGTTSSTTSSPSHNTPSPYSTSPAGSRFPNGHGSAADDHATFTASSSDRFGYDRSTSRNSSSAALSSSAAPVDVVVGPDFRRGGGGYHESTVAGGTSRLTGRNRGDRDRDRDRPYRSTNGPSSTYLDSVGANRSVRTTATGGGVPGGSVAPSSAVTAPSWSSYETTTRYNSTGSSQADTGYSTTPSENDRRTTDQSSKKKIATKSRSGSRSVSPSGSTSSRSPSRSRSRSSSSSSSSSTSRATSSTGSPKSRRVTSSSNVNSNHQPVVHSDDRRPLAICVRNLPLRSSDTSLKDGLFHEYKKHGKVTWVKVVGQNSERHAIVCFKKPEDVEKALEVSYDKLFFGCKIEVAPYQGYEVEDNDCRPYEAEIDEYHQRATRTLFIGNLEKDVTASDLRKHFDQFGEIIEIDIKKQGAVSSYAFCQYSDIVSVVKAIRKMDGEHLGNNRIKLGFGKSMPYNCVWVDGINENVNEKYLRMHFDTFGVINKVHIDRDKGQALIFYEQVSSAQAAVSKMRGFVLKNSKLQVDYASRECQESFFERMEKQGNTLERTTVFDERRELSSRSFESSSIGRFSRYDVPPRPRTASYSSRSSLSAVAVVSSSIQSPGGATPGSVTPRGTTGSRSARSRFVTDYYEQGIDYPSDRHFRNYDEYSQGSAASHDDVIYEPEYFVHEGPINLDVIDTRSMPSQLVDTVPFAPADIRNLQKERVHLLEQLEECPSSSDELMSPKKRLKLDLLDSGADVIIEANRDHRKVMEVRRLSDTNLKHHSRRPSIDATSKHSNRDLKHDISYMPHAVCKRRKTASSDSGSKVHHYDHSGSESVGGSRPGTPLCDERPENLQPTEPRRVVGRDREGPLTLPLPRFAAQVMNRGSVSVAGIKGQKDNVLSSPPAVTSPRISNPRPPSPVHVPPPASPPPRPPSISSNSSDSDITPPSPSLEERIRSLDEKYEKWSGSRTLTTPATGDAKFLETFRQRHKLLDLDLKEVQPSEIVKSVMAKRSVFDEDLKRLENVGEKYEPKEFPLFPRVGSCTTLTNQQQQQQQSSVPATPLSAPPTLKLAPITQLPKTPSLLSPRSAGAALPAVKGLQYPFPTHQPVLMSPIPPVIPQPPPTPSTTTAVSSTSGSLLTATSLANATTMSMTALTTSSSTIITPSSTTSARGNASCHGDNRLKPCASVSSETTRTTSKVTVNRSNIVSCNKMPDNKTIGSGDQVSPSSEKSVNKSVRETKSSDKTSEKILTRRDSNSSNSPRADVKTRRNSDTSARRIEDNETSNNKEKEQNEERKKERLEKVRLENEKLEKEKQEKERIERERLEKEKQDKERLEREKIEKDRLERESELEKQRLEKERLEKEREEKIRLEKEQAERERLQKEKEEKEKRQKEERERKERERKEREERERKEREERERKEREEREKEQLEKERREKEEREREEREKKEKEEKERREREERERKEKEEKERREREEKERKLEEERVEKERHEKEKQLERERKREEERARHKEDNHDKRNDHKHREINSETKHKDSSSSIEKHVHDSKTTKDDKFSIQHEENRRDSHSSSHEKSKHHIEREERRKDSIKENRDNNVHDKQKGIESRHLSIDLDKNKTLSDSNKRKERNNSVPANIGSKRRMSSHELSSDHPEPESKKIKLGHEHKKVSERRDSRDSTRSEDRSKSSSKHKNNSAKSHEKHNSSRECDEKRKEKEREERHKKHKLEKQKSKSKSREKESQENPPLPKSPVSDKDFLARLELRSAEDMEKQKKDKEAMRQKSRELLTDEKEPKTIEEKIKKEKQQLEKQPTQEKPIKNRSDNDSSKSSEEKKPKRDRLRKITNSSDSDSDEPKKHSIFDIVDDEPAYISMYDKVKARSCKNMAKQEEEKRQEKIKAKFSQLKQSRAKREEKKRSTSWDEDSDSERDPSEVKVKRCPKMLIDSSDDENQDRKSRKKKEYSDSDSSAILRQVKQEPIDTSEDEIKNKSSSKIRTEGDRSEDEHMKPKLLLKNEIKTEMVSDENTEDVDDKSQMTKVKEETLLNKERRNSKHSDTPIESQIYNEITEIKQEKMSNRHNFMDNTSDEETHEINKKERREKKHKKKQKKQKHSISSEDVSKVEGLDQTQIETVEKSKHHEKKKEHGKKEKRRDKTKEGREKSKKSKKNKSENKSEIKKEGKMENIFGSLSDDSETCTKDVEQQEQKIPTFISEEPSLPVYASENEKEPTEPKIKEKSEREKDREEHKRKKEKKRREKERRLQEAAAAAAAAAAATSVVAEQTSNENSMDFADMGKQLEENMLRDDSMEATEQAPKDNEESNFENAEDPFKFIDVPEMSKSKEKEERREVKEKKKKRKKSKEEKSKHHHHHHHEKSKSKSESKKEILPLPTEEEEEVKEEVDQQHKPQDPSLPSLLEEPSIPEETPVEKDPIVPATEEPATDVQSPEAATPKETNNLLPAFIDEKLHESAVQSISQFVEETPAAAAKEEEEIKSDSAAEFVEEKPRVVISQEETEDAVAALLGESFGSSGQFEECYEEDINETNDQSSTLVEETLNPQDDEEMRQAVQSLSTGDLDVKPDTPQSETELQIDTDTEEQDDVPPPRYDAPPKTPDIDLSRPKTPQGYFQNTPDSKISTPATPAKPATPTPLIIKAPNSPPSLTPIKPLSSAAIAEVTKVLDLEPKSLPLLPDNTRSVISQSWTEKKQEAVVVTKEPEPPITETQPKIITASPVRVLTTPSVLKISEPTVYPPLQPISKPEPTSVPQTTEQSKVPPLQTVSSPNVSQMHNLPARPPVQNSSKPQPSIHDGVVQQKLPMMHNRLPITSVMVSKPLQPTTVILQQSKIAHSLEPPKLVSTADPRSQERPRMVFQAAAIQSPQFQPRMMVQGNIRHLTPQGLLVPTRQLNPHSFGYLGNMPHSTYNISPIIKDNLPPGDKKPTAIESQVKVSQPGLITTQNCPVPKTPTVLGITPPLSLSQPLSLPKVQSPKPPTPNLHSPKSQTPAVQNLNPQSLNPQSPKLSLQTSPVAKPSSSPLLSPVLKLVLPSSPNPAIPHSVITQPSGTSPASSPSPKPPPVSLSAEPQSIIVKSSKPSEEDAVSATDTIKEVPKQEKTSIPSTVIISTVKEEPAKKEEEEKKPLEAEEPIKLAIEKVTEELNMSLDKEIRDNTENKPEPVEEKPETPEEQSKPNEPSEEKPPEVPPETNPSSIEDKIEESKETISVNKEIEKFEEEKADTESIISDISKERLSADILAKDDPLDTKEDSDYWSAKEVNIDSVIKTLCSADELSDHSSENGKDDWDNGNKSDNLFIPEPVEKEPQPLEKKEEVIVNESKSDDSEVLQEDVTETEGEQKEVISTRTASRGRGTRGRGRGKTRGTVERGSIQTRRGKLATTVITSPALPATPNKRGRITRAKPERKASKAESEGTPADIYEFRDETDDSNKEQRPRLILTIKSPAISNSNNAQTTAIVKEVTKDGAKEIVKEVVHPAVIKTTVEPKEFASPATTNKRKSKRLQEKDIRNTVDDTIEDVVKNNVITRAAANQRRMTRQSTPKVQTTIPQLPETPRKSPRGRKTRRGSEATETSSSEETSRDETAKTMLSPAKEVEKVKEPEEEIKVPEAPKEKPLEGLKAAFLKRIKRDQAVAVDTKAPSPAQREPRNLIDPVTGEIIPMRECEEGKYIPLPGTKPAEAKPEETAAIKEVIRTTPEIKPIEIKPQPTVIAQPQPITIVQQSKPQTLKAHVLSSQAAQAAQLSTVAHVQPPPVQAKITVQPTQIVTVKNPPIGVIPPTSIPTRTLIAPVSVAKSIAPVAITKSVTPIVATKVASPVVSKPVTPISQHLNVNTSLGMGVESAMHLSPRPNMNLAAKQMVKPPVVSPVLAANQQKQVLPTSKELLILDNHHRITLKRLQKVNSQIAHFEHQQVLKQQVVIGKGPLVKQTHHLHPQQILTAAVPNPPLSKSQSPLSNNPRIIQGPTPVGPKGIMEPPKVDVSMANVMLGQRPKLSPQGPHQRLVGQAGMPVPAYEASLGEAITHFPPGPLRPPPDLNPAHYMHPSHVMQYQQYLRQQQLHLTRSGGAEKIGDGQEGEKAPVTSPPLELRRTGSVGIALAGRGAAVPHSLHSPHDRATDSPQVGQVYNVHSDRVPPYYTANRYFDHAEPPPAHQQNNSHAPLAALGSDRGRAAHITSMGTPDRPLSGGHPAISAHMGTLASTPERSALSALGPPDRASLGGLSTPDRPLSSHIERPLSSSSTLGMMGAGLGAAGNLMGAVARHIGADTPTSQRDLQAATPPHASQVPPQAESLFLMLTKQYPCMWQGLLALKNDQAAVQMYFVSGNDDVAKCCLPKNTDGSTPPLRIFQRMRLEPPQVEGVARKMQMENEHCMLLALPCGHDHMDVLKQSNNLTNGFITYLQQKQAAGIVNVAAPGTTQPPAYVVHIFPSCDFVNENLRRIAPSLLERVADIAHLLIVITTV